MLSHAKRLSLKEFLLISSFLLPSLGFASATPEEVSKQLVEAFAKGTGIRTAKPGIVEKSHVGFRTRTVTFAIGPRTYRIVFTSDGLVSIAGLNEGDIAAQPLWTKKADQTTVEEIVNFIYSRETGRKFDPSGLEKGDAETKADLDAERIRKKAQRVGDGSELRWNQLMNQVARGDVAGLATQTGGPPTEEGLAHAVGMGKALDPCGSSSGGASPQRAAITQLAQAMAAAVAAQMAVAGQGKKTNRDLEGLADRTREYEKKGTQSVLEDLEKHKPAEAPEELFRLFQDTGSNTTELFRKALAESDKTSKDPYSLAAGRNFKSMIRRFGEKKSAALVGSVLKRIVVDITAFTEYRKLSSRAPVIYDRFLNQFFVDPTLNSPSEVRYLLSLATWYEAEMEDFKLIETLENYRQMRKKISEMERATLTDNDEREWILRKSEADESLRKLFGFARHVTKDPAYPR